MKPIKINRTLSTQIVEAIHEVTGCPINFINRNGIIIASTNLSRINTFHEAGYTAIMKGKHVTVEEDHHYEGAKKGVNHPIIMEGTAIAVIGITGEPEEVSKYVFLATKITEVFIREQRLKQMNEDKKQHLNYMIHSLIYHELDDTKTLELMLHELDVKVEHEYAVIMVKLNNRYNINNICLIEREINELMKQLNIKLFTYMYPNEYIGFIHKSQYQLSRQYIKNFCEKYKEILYIGIGTLAPLFSAAQSYENAKIALLSANSSGASFQYFEDLTLEMILGSVDDNVKRQYINKVLYYLSESEICLLNQYFKNNMNLKQTAGDMFLHINTLQYKLDKIAGKTMLNPRIFRDAVVLYTALQLSNLIQHRYDGKSYQL